MAFIFPQQTASAGSLSLAHLGDLIFASDVQNQPIRRNRTLYYASSNTSQRGDIPRMRLSLPRGGFDSLYRGVVSQRHSEILVDSQTLSCPLVLSLILHFLRFPLTSRHHTDSLISTLQRIVYFHHGFLPSSSSNFITSQILPSPGETIISTIAIKGTPRTTSFRRTSFRRTSSCRNITDSEIKSTFPRFEYRQLRFARSSLSQLSRLCSTPRCPVSQCTTGSSPKAL